MNFDEFKDVCMAFTKLFTTLQKQMGDANFDVIQNACILNTNNKELAELIMKTKNIATLFQFFALNKAWCNWLNIRFLEIMANASDSSKLTCLVENYKQAIYSKTLKEVWIYIPCHEVRTKCYSEFQIKFKDQDPANVTVQQFIQQCMQYVIEDIAKAMLIGKVEEGSLKIVLLIPTDNVYQTYLSALLLPQELRLDSYLQIGYWVVYHPRLVMQSLQNEYCK